jgi:hypothetical protein
MVFSPTNYLLSPPSLFRLYLRPPAAPQLPAYSLAARPANNIDGIGDGNCHFFVVSRVAPAK